MVSTLTTYAGSATAGFEADGRSLPSLIVLIFVLRGALAIAVVRPWQHPDEPQHLALGLSLIRSRGHFPKGGYDVQSGINQEP